MDYFVVYFRYDGGANIIGYDACDSSTNTSTSVHTNYQPNYCPTKTYKISTGSPIDGDIVDWTADPISDRVYAIEFSTTTSNSSIYLFIF